VSEDRTHMRDLYDEELADANPADLALVEAVQRGDLEYVPMTPEEEQELIEAMNVAAATLPGDPDDMLVVTSLRLSLRVFNAIKEFAVAGNPKPAALMRRWIEEGLARETGQRLEVVAEPERVAGRALPSPEPLGELPGGDSGIATVRVEQLRRELEQAVQRAIVPPASA
jgi:hypothetical protein